MTGDGWTIDEAVAEFARQGMPVDPGRFRAAVRAARLQRIGETSSGAKGGRGQALYDIGQLQRLHAALSPWLVPRNPPPAPVCPKCGMPGCLEDKALDF
jgi:hypothetical protein